MFVYKNHNSNGVLLVTKEYQQILKIKDFRKKRGVLLRMLYRIS